MTPWIRAAELDLFFFYLNHVKGFKSCGIEKSYVTVSV